MDSFTDKTGGETEAYEPDRLACVLQALRKIRINVIYEEFRLQEMIAEKLTEASLEFKKEYKLAARNRIDFLVDGGIGIEVKKGRPNRTQVLKQLERYAAFEEISAVILVVERNVYIPDIVNSKRCILFGLNRLWGVALRRKTRSKKQKRQVKRIRLRYHMVMKPL
jgi:hypothetical protein